MKSSLVVQWMHPDHQNIVIITAIPQQLSYAHITNYTGITSIFDESSHLRPIPSRLAGNINLLHWHPVVNGSGGGTIISTFSFL